MSTVVKDLGAVSAYAYAVEKGYTGTEAEFAELMADYAEVGQRAEDAADSALESKTAAQTAANTATNKASEATTAAETATTKAGEAQTSAQTASTKASEASQSASTASTKAGEAAQSASDADTAKDDAVAAKTAAETAQGKAEDAQAAAEAVAESIPSDYSQLSEDVTELKENLNNVDNRVSVLEQGSSGLTDAVKLALLQLAEKVAYIDDDGQDYYGDLYDALYAVTAISLNTNSLSLVSIGSTSQLTATTVPTGGTVTWSSSDTSIATVNNGLVTAIGYGTATITATAGSASATCSVLVEQASVTSISAVYTQTRTVYDIDSLDVLKSDLVVTAHYSDGTSAAVTDYALSGTLNTGTSIITVNYMGKATTFNAIVSESTDVLYLLRDRTFNNDGHVDTGINLLLEDSSFSIVCDCAFIPPQTTSKQWTIFKCTQAVSPWVGMVAMPRTNTSNTLNFSWMGKWSSDISCNRSSYDGTLKFVLTHEIGSNELVWYAKMGTDEILTGNISGTYTSVDRLLAVGGSQDDSQTWSGTINDFVIYERVLSTNEINNFMAD